MRSRKDIRTFRIIAGTVMAIVGAIVLFVCATTMLTCTRVEPQELRCQMRKAVLGFLPIQDRAIHGLHGAFTETRTSEPSAFARSSMPRVGRRVVLVTDEGDIPVSNFGSTDTSQLEEEVSRFVQDGGQRSLVVRHAFDGARLGNVAGSCLVLPMLIGIPAALLGYLRRRSPARHRPHPRRSRSGT